MSNDKVFLSYLRQYLKERIWEARAQGNTVTPDGFYSRCKEGVCLIGALHETGAFNDSELRLELELNSPALEAGFCGWAVYEEDELYKLGKSLRKEAGPPL